MSSPPNVNPSSHRPTAVNSFARHEHGRPGQHFDRPPFQRIEIGPAVAAGCSAEQTGPAEQHRAMQQGRDGRPAAIRNLRPAAGIRKRGPIMPTSG